MSTGTGGVNSSGGAVNLQGVVLDPASAEEIAKAKAAARRTEQAAVVPPAGGDSFGTGGTTTLGGGDSALTQDIIGKVFGGVDPQPSDPTLAAKHRGIIHAAPGFPEAVTDAQQLMQDPSPDNLAKFQSSIGGLPMFGNVMETLLEVIKESVIDANEDKKYYLAKLNDFNKIGQALSDQLKTLDDASSQLTAASAGKSANDLNNVRVPAEIKSFDTATLGPDGKPVVTSDTTESVNRDSLSSRIKDVESMQEDLRNHRSMAQTSYQAIDQRVNQLYEIMAQVSKTMNDERGAPIRNML